jgi:hypothetical protein
VWVQDPQKSPTDFISNQDLNPDRAVRQGVEANIFVLITNLTHFLNVFISLLYMFRATQCSSSGESILSIHHLEYITLCRWLSDMQVREREDNIKMDLQEVGCGGMDWSDLAHDRERWRALVNAALNLLFPQNVENFLASRGPISFSRDSGLWSE